MISKDVVISIFKKIQGPADLNLFFDKLNSAKWVEPLFSLDAFEEPPKIVRVDDGVMFPFWSASRYLARMADKNPKTILKVIKAIPATENTRIHEDFVEAATKMPGAEASQLAGAVVTWLDGPHQLLLARKVAHYLAHLQKEGFKKQALTVASALLGVSLQERKSDSNDQVLFKNIVPTVRNDWEYRECLKVIAPAYVTSEKRDLIFLLIAKLEEAIRLGDRVGEGDFADHSHYWRGSIEGTGHGYDIKDAIVDWIRDLAEEFAMECPHLAEALALKLRKMPLAVFSRISLHLVRVVKIQSLVKPLIFDEQLFDSSETWHEYVMLLELHFNALSEADRSSFIQLIESFKYSRYESEADADYAERVERLKYEYYFIIGKLLKGPDRRRFEEMKAKYGVPDHPTLSHYTECWSGPNSPKSIDELEKMSADELINYLNTWIQPDQFRIGPVDSVEGLGLELQKLVQKNPKLFLANLVRLRLRERAYVSAVVQGVGKTLGSMSAAVWPPFIEYLMWVALHPNDEGKDNDWRWERLETCRVISNAFRIKENGLPFNLRDKAWQLIQLGLNDNSPDANNEDDLAIDKNYYGAAINSTRGVALEAAIHYGFWVKYNLVAAGKTFSEADCEELFAALDKHLDINVEKSRAIRSVYGVFFPSLKVLGPGWIRKSRTKIFPEAGPADSYWRAAWVAYISFCDVYTDIFEILEGEYEKAMSAFENKDEKTRERTDERLVDHLISLYLGGFIDLHGSHVKSLISKANLKLRTRIIEIIGRGLKDPETTPDVVDRAKVFWDARKQSCKSVPIAERIELSAFGWWMDAKLLPGDWMLDQAIEAIILSQKLNPDFIVCEALEKLVDQHPQKVAEIVRLMVENKVGDYGFITWIDNARTILARLLKSSSRQTAVDVINLLVAMNYRDFGALLK